MVPAPVPAEWSLQTGGPYVRIQVVFKTGFTVLRCLWWIEGPQVSEISYTLAEISSGKRCIMC